WVFCGDGEMDEPESLGAIGMAVREKLDNLVFIVNCNLQRLDGPVRGNGKIIQELEADFRGAGWNVIKLIWGSYWDPLLARDKDEDRPFYKPAPDSPVMKYLLDLRAALGGFLPLGRRQAFQPMPVPKLEAFEAQLKSSEGREISTTMAFVRILTTLVRDKN